MTDAYKFYTAAFDAMALLDEAWWTTTDIRLRLKITRIRLYLSEQAAQSLPKWPYTEPEPRAMPVIRDRGVRADAISRF